MEVYENKECRDHKIWIDHFNNTFFGNSVRLFTVLTLGG
jgi:hypothetical protein